MDEDLIHSVYETLMTTGRRMRANLDYVGGNEALSVADRFLRAHLTEGCKFGDVDASDFALRALREKLS